MQNYQFPEGMRISSIKEREAYYRKEFTRKEEKRIKKWLKDYKKPVITMDLGTDSGIYKKGYEKLYKKSMIYFEKKIIINELKKNLLKYLPEDAYYARNMYDEKGKWIAQELAFDLDPENISCDKCNEYKNVYSFCPRCFEKVRRQAIRLYKLMSKRFKKVKIVYSGRGFHIHVFDKKGFEMSFKERRKLTRMLLKKGFAIDEWVTNGHIDLIRLPYSLHGLISRKVLPLTLKQLERFNIDSKLTKPKFVK